jgi:hypothetical protein
MLELMQRQPATSLTYIPPKRASFLLGKYQFVYVVFRKRVLLEGAMVQQCASQRHYGSLTTRYRSIASFILCSSVAENWPFL